MVESTTMPPRNTFQYQPLETDNTIRILQLDPATDIGAPLSGSLVHCSTLSSESSYYAISYVWGQQDFLEDLELHDHDGDTSYIRITSNVADVLRRFRAPTRSSQQSLWIDAICLNQDDTAEKAHQIPIMGRIYEQAIGALIWLGHEDRYTAHILSYLHEIVLAPPPLSKEAEIEMLKITAKHLPRDSNPFADDFCRRPWFSRRWIVQEAWLAGKRSSTVFCGRHTINLQTLIIASQKLQEYRLFDYATNMLASLRSTAVKTSMLELLWHFHRADCLDPRDRIAALFGLIPEDSRFPMDYTAHWLEMYRQAAIFVFQSGSNDTRLQLLLHLFEFGPALRGMDPGATSYPSWVPDWSQIRRRWLPFLSPRLFVDADPEYPTQPGYPSVSVLTFQEDVLRIHWPPVFAGPCGRRVIRSYSLGPDTNLTEAQKSEATLAILKELFPPTKQSTPHILTFCSLAENLVRFFCTRPFNNNPIKTPEFDQYLKYIRRKLPASSNPEVLESLRYLGIVLQTHHLFVLDDCQQEGSSTGLSYGFTHLRVDEGDVMVPVWRPASTLHDGPDWNGETEKNFMTMLVVAGVSTEIEAPVGRILGPAICCTANNSLSQYLNSSKRPESTGDGWYSMCLL